MAPDASRRNRLRALADANAAPAFLGGLVVFGIAALLLGVLAAESHASPLTHRQSQTIDGRTTLAYFVTPYVQEESLLEVSYEFPEASGDAYLVHCIDYERLKFHEAPREPIVRQEDSRDGEFSRPMLGGFGYSDQVFYYDPDDRPTPPADRTGSVGRQGTADYCIGFWVVFQWAAASHGDNFPEVTASVREVPLDPAPVGVLFALAAVAGLVAVASGLLLGRRRRRAPRREDDGTGTAETLYRLAVSSEAWLARARRYLLLAGPLGVFLWYPVVVTWAWRAGRAGSSDPWMPWALAAAGLAFLAGLTLLWAREFLRLDRELRAWREQIAEMRRREEELMAELES